MRAEMRTDRNTTRPRFPLASSQGRCTVRPRTPALPRPCGTAQVSAPTGAHCLELRHRQSRSGGHHYLAQVAGLQHRGGRRRPDRQQPFSRRPAHRRLLHLGRIGLLGGRGGRRMWHDHPGIDQRHDRGGPWLVRRPCLRRPRPFRDGTEERVVLPGGKTDRGHAAREQRRGRGPDLGPLRRRRDGRVAAAARRRRGHRPGAQGPQTRRAGPGRRWSGGTCTVSLPTA